MIQIHKEADTIKILKNEKRVYTVGSKAYKCLHAAGYSSDQIVSYIENFYSIKLQEDEVKQIKDYFRQLS